MMVELEGVGNAESVRRPALAPTLASTCDAGIESRDFDFQESSHFVEYLNSLGPLSKSKSLLRWILLLSVGALTGCVGLCIDIMVENFFWLRCVLTDSMVELNIFVQYLVYVGVCMALAAVAGFLVCFVEPLAAGSGIPEIKCYLNGVDLKNVCRLKTLIAKAVGVMFSVSAGLPCGKEGPMIHSGAVVGSTVATCANLSLLRSYRIELEVRDFVTSGAAAGVAAAFGAPVGGVLFAMEEGSSFWNPKIMLRTFVSASCAAFTISFFMAGLKDVHAWGLMGALFSFGHFGFNTWRLWELPIFMLMGALGGLGGAAFNASNTVLTRWRMRRIGSRGKRFAEVLLVTGVIASVNFAFPVLMDGCVPFADLSDEAKLFRQPGTQVINILFHEGKMREFYLFIFGSVYYVLACWTYGLGVPSGLFVPSLLVGASFGRIVGQWMHSLPLSPSSPGIYSLIGACACLSGMARITISLAVILIEATGDTAWSLPIIATVLTAKVVGDVFNCGLYDIHIHLKRIPLLDESAEPAFMHHTARDVMTREVTTLEPTMRVGTLLQHLGNNNHHAFPVLRSGKYVGTLKRSTVHQVLVSGREYSIFQPAVSHGAAVPFIEILRQYPSFPSFREVQEHVCDVQDHYVDLGPYINHGGYTVPEDAALVRVYMLFRGMGLRHLPVVSHEGQVCGMITRKDLILIEDAPDARCEQSAHDDAEGARWRGVAQSWPPLLAQSDDQVSHIA